MFDTEYSFEELPLSVGTIEVTFCTGTALLEGDVGTHDYGFSVTGIELDGNLLGNYRDKRTLQISEGHDDPFCALLFQKLASRLQADSCAADHYYTALADHIRSAA